MADSPRTVLRRPKRLQSNAPTNTPAHNKLVTRVQGKHKWHTWQRDGTQQQLPLRRLLDTSVVDDTGDNRAGEYAVGEGDLNDVYH